MPMPADGPWPPTAYAPAYASYRDWDALYAGNPDRLREVYSRRGTTATASPEIRNRPSQYRGGIFGRLSRFLWGHPVPQEGRDTRLHVPVPADLSATAAKLLFGEPATFKTEGTPGKDKLEAMAEEGLHGFLYGAAEADSAFGDIYLRPVIDKELSPDAAIPTVVHADGAIPTLRWGRLVDVTFWSVVASDDTKVLRLFELHEKGRNSYQLCEGTHDRRGSIVSLDRLPEHLAYITLGLDAAGGYGTGLDRIDVIHIPNDEPQREWRTDAYLKYLGRSDYSGSEQFFDASDEVWTSWMRDIRLAKGRLFVPDVMLQDLGPGQGAAWDADREVYAALNALPDQMGSNPLTATQFAIRIEEHRGTLEALQEVVLRHAGISASTIGDPPEGAQMTATETNARERLSFMTGGRRQGIWKPKLAAYIELQTMVEKHAQLPGAVEPFRPTVEFSDSVSESPEVLARTAQLLRAANAASTETLVQMVNPGLEPDEVKNEVDRIQAEEGRKLENPEFSGLGSRSGQPPTGKPGDTEKPPAEGKPAPPKGDA
jgi:hypothetical protein